MLGRRSLQPPDVGALPIGPCFWRATDMAAAELCGRAMKLYRSCSTNVIVDCVSYSFLFQCH